MVSRSPPTPPSRRHAGLARGPWVDGNRVSGRLWIERNGQTYLAWGRVVLLERIAELGSISAAARSMGMSYRHAWALVSSMNELAPEVLVYKSVGGAQGGGAQLTEAGQAAVAEFWRMVSAFGKWMEAQRPGTPRRRR